MNLWVRQLRGLCLVGMVLAGVGFCAAVGAVATAGHAAAQSAGCDRRRRQPPGRGRDHPLLFPAQPGRTPRQLQDRPGAQGALCHRPVPGRPHQSVRRPADRHGGGKSGDQPGRLRGQHEAQGRPARQRSAVEDPRHAVAPDRAGRRAAHRRNLPAQRPLRRPRRSEDHRASEQPRRSRVRDQGRRKDRRQEDHLRRQQGLWRPAAARTRSRPSKRRGSGLWRFSSPPTSTIPTASKPIAT